MAFRERNKRIFVPELGKRHHSVMFANDWRVVLSFVITNRYGHNAKVVHFLGKVKPWNYSYDAQRGEVRGHSVSPDSCQMHPNYLLQWWQLYAASILPLLQKAYGDAPFSSGFVNQSSPVRAGVNEKQNGVGWGRGVCVCVYAWNEAMIQMPINVSCIKFVVACHKIISCRNPQITGCCFFPLMLSLRLHFYKSVVVNVVVEFRKKKKHEQND